MHLARRQIYCKKRVVQENGESFLCPTQLRKTPCDLRQEKRGKREAIG